MSDKDPNQVPANKEQEDQNLDDNNGDDGANKPKVPSHTCVMEIGTGLPVGDGSDNDSDGNVGAAGNLGKGDNGGVMKDQAKERGRERDREDENDSKAHGDNTDRVRRLMLGKNPNFVFVPQNIPFGGVSGSGPWMGVNPGMVASGLP
jgi:hypothetical protein